MWQHIKDILQNEKGKCIIVEEGKPAFVLLRFEEYLNLKKTKAEQGDSLEHHNGFESIFVADQSRKLADADKEEKKIRIEDLPF